LKERVAGFLMLAAWIAVSYFGITLLTFAWYWPVGAGLIVGLTLYGLLLGPEGAGRRPDAKDRCLKIA
jgi:hypothetical protein